MITTEKVRELYATADHYDAKHPRRELQEEEFDDWLAAHDAETNWRAAEVVWALLDKMSGNTWSRETDILERVREHVDQAREFAREQGINVPEPSGGK